MTKSFEYYSPTKVYFGKGEEKKVGTYIREYGASHVLLVYGVNSVKKSGLLDSIKQSLKSEHIDFSEISGVVPNPTLDKVYEGIDLGKRKCCDFILAIGGGSAIDTAKAVAYGLGEPDKDVWELYEHTRTAKKCLPVASVLTITAAGSETSRGSVITNKSIESKRAYDDNLARPVFAIMDPELTMSVPDYQTESGCVDIMMHTMERYFTNDGDMEITDSLAEALLRTVMKNALILHTNPQNYEARAEIMWAGSLSHNDLTGCGNGNGDFMSHKLEHEVGGMFDVTHGAGLAAIWPSWARYVVADCLHKFTRFAINVMGVKKARSEMDIALSGISAMETFYHQIGMPVNFKDLGITPTDEQIEIMAQRCLKASGDHTGAAKKLSLSDMIKIYKNAR